MQQLEVWNPELFLYTSVSLEGWAIFIPEEEVRHVVFDQSLQGQHEQITPVAKNDMPGT